MIKEPFTKTKIIKIIKTKRRLIFMAQQILAFEFATTTDPTILKIDKILSKL